jgi:hypothetical protein
MMKLHTAYLFLLCSLCTGIANAQQLTEWVETRQSASDPVIALGYPVPIPVDTPIPFDGFRTYAGLHMRHLDLAATTDYVHQEEVGTTQSGRTIWAYRLGDEDRLTIDGWPEPAMFTNGGIHAREWQSPEVVTGILELFALKASDRHFYDYLRDNVNMIVIPSLNIDGFLQTQRTPTFNYLQIDPDFPNDYPRDGRMRRKNMRNVDEDLSTTGDLLNGIDLNRNNAPFWATSSSSSGDQRSIVYHGGAAQSESETRALDGAAALGPAEQLRVYTDVHSFSQVQLWAASNNNRLSTQNIEVMSAFRNHHQAFPAGKTYYVPPRGAVSTGRGIGSTDEYFTYTYEVPAWTLEIEPTGGQPYHAPLPGNGADYGGVSENGHDGFILPESEIRRVREQVAQSMAAVYYRQAGPPNVQALRITDTETGAVIYDAKWDRVDSQSRELVVNQLRALRLNHDYEFWLSFNKPMRWRENGQTVPFPGRTTSGMNVNTKILINGTELNATISENEWLAQPGGAPDGYVNYQTDAVKMIVNFVDDTDNQALIAGGAEATLQLFTSDMTNFSIDGNPATVASWEGGHWSNHENSSGNDSDFGGLDTTLKFQMTDQTVEPSFLIDTSISSSWFDPSHNGEGFLLEMLANNIALVSWYTFDKDGNQDWYVGTGKVHGNSIEFAQMYQAAGGQFGPGFNPDKITRHIVGSASFIWSTCNSGSMSYQFGPAHGRQTLTRLTALLEIPCPDDPASQVPVSDFARLSGTWYDPSHDGEGFSLQVLAGNRVLVNWFSYDINANRRWFYGVGELRNGVIVVDDMLTSSGGKFGPDFDPANVMQTSWGTLELHIDCSGGTATYSSTEDGFGSGVLNIQKITNLNGPVSCQPEP